LHSRGLSQFFSAAFDKAGPRGFLDIGAGQISAIRRHYEASAPAAHTASLNRRFQRLMAVLE
jgi:hypothetical protein